METDFFNYSRRESVEVHVGNTCIGAANPVRIQSMTNTSTMDTDACVEQSKRIIDAGGELVRLTTQGVREAENLLTEAKEIVVEAVERCAEKKVTDWSTIKNTLKDDLSDYLWKKMKRIPVILPIIMEAQ